MNSEKKSPFPNSHDYGEYLPAIDVMDGVRRVMNNKKIYFKLLKRFNVREFADILLDSMQKSDFSAIKNNAHTLKGAAANLAFSELKDLSAAIEERAKAEADCSDLIAPLESATNNAIQTVEFLLQKEDN